MGSLLTILLLVFLAATADHPGGRVPRRLWTTPVLTTGSITTFSPEPLETSAPFWVRLSPKQAAVPPGGSLWVNCSSDCTHPQDSGLRTQLRRGATRTGPGWVSYQLLDVRAWSSDVYCFFTCAGETRGATARITAYQRPRSVILEPPILDGDEYTLRCHITQVFPVGFLVVKLRWGGRLLYSESLERFTNHHPANVTVTYSMLRTRTLDLGLPVTCHARLSLDGLVIRSSSAPMMLPELTLHPTSKTLAAASIAALAGIFLVVGVTYLRMMHQ